MTTEQTIRDFMRLPPEALPSARWTDERENDDDPWPFLRDYVANEQTMLHDGDSVRLTADRDGWRDGVVVVLD